MNTLEAVKALRSRADRLEAELSYILTLHHDNDGECAECGYPYPCDTAKHLSA